MSKIAVYTMKTDVKPESAKITDVALQLARVYCAQHNLVLYKFIGDAVIEKLKREKKKKK